MKGARGNVGRLGSFYFFLLLWGWGPRVGKVTRYSPSVREGDKSVTVPGVAVLPSAGTQAAASRDGA